MPKEKRVNHDRYSLYGCSILNKVKSYRLLRVEMGVFHIYIIHYQH